MSGLRFDRWEDVVAFALALPHTELTPYYDTEAVKLRGKAIVSPGHEPGSFHVRSPHDEKTVLLATDPATFWQTPHYANWPGLLVRYGGDEGERIATVIRRAWWDGASITQRKAFGARP